MTTDYSFNKSTDLSSGWIQVLILRLIKNNYVLDFYHLTSVKRAVFRHFFKDTMKVERG